MVGHYRPSATAQRGGVRGVDAWWISSGVRVQRERRQARRYGVRIPAGKFPMGYTSDEAFDDEQPVTQVRIGRAFDRGKYEVTQRQWEAVMGTNPSDNTGCAQCPVEQVSWHDAQDFTRRLNAIDGAGTYPFGERSGLGVRDAGGGRCASILRSFASAFSFRRRIDRRGCFQIPRKASNHAETFLQVDVQFKAPGY